MLLKIRISCISQISRNWINERLGENKLIQNRRQLQKTESEKKEREKEREREREK